MDRNKTGGAPGRPPKAKLGVPLHGSELFALGSKSSGSRDDGKSKVMSSSKSVSDHRKRDSSSTISNPPTKKPKLASSSLGGSSGSRLLDTGGSAASMSSGSSSAAGSSSSGAQQIDVWEQVAIDCDSAELVNAVLGTIEMQDSDGVIALICGAIKSIIFPRSKPDPMMSLSLLYLAKVRPQLFCNETIASALLSILKRETSHAPFKSRSNTTMHILACNLLARGYHNKTTWPERFVRVYIEDAINERVWVDLEDCSSFIENICTAFGTRTPPKSMLLPEIGSLSTPISSTRDLLGLDDDSAETNSDNFRISSSDFGNIDCPTQPRYAHLTTVIEKMVLDSVKELLNRRQAPDSSTRNLLRFLSATSGLTEIRILASHGGRLEHWMHNGKLMKPAQELLTYICYNVTGNTPRDHEVLANLVKIRLKTKPLINIYMSCLREMINLQPNILYIVLKYVVQNELSSVRNPNNMGMLASMFQAKPEDAAQHLAEIYQEFLMQREDCLRTLRVFLRELVKMLRFDIKLTVFAKMLVTPTKTMRSLCESVDYRDRIVASMTDLVCLCMFLCVSPQIKEANVSFRSGRETRSSNILIEYYQQISQIQGDALQWVFNVVPHLFHPVEADYTQYLKKILFLDAPEQYSKADQWPPEQERSLLIRLVSEIPFSQDSILCIILIGINKDIPFKVPDSVELIEQVVRRAAGLKIFDFPVLEANKLEIIDFLFNMAEYHHPENIGLPVGYEPPKLAISSLYWKAWNVLLMLSAHNPGTFGAFCWEQYPMLRNLMEMCITNQFMDSKPPDDELQVAALERTHILEFETHLAAATSKVVITEQNSLLLSQLMLMDPMGVARRPPMHILEQFQNQNATHKLGHLLCRSRKPDLLLDIIQRQGSSQSMPWLADLVQNSDGDFNHLPVQCLCEFLLSNANTLNEENSRDIELLAYLQKLLVDESGDHQTSCEVLEYFLRRLSSTNKHSRGLAINGLRLLLKVFHNKEEVIAAGLDYEEEEQESDWLLRYLPMMPYFMSVRLIVIVQLRAACQIENNPDLVMIYIQFIATNTQNDHVPDMLEHVMDMSQLIVERSTVFSSIIPIITEEGVTDECRLQTLNCLFVMYNNYLIKLREHKTPIAWPEYADLLMVHFTDGTQLPIHLNIIQAFVILLTYSPMITNSQPILDYWFPPGAIPPQALNMDATNEPVQILPDWLKLKMIRSSVDRLVDAALIDLTPDQIVLFVQNFGTPVNSMSKLLALLDRAVIEQIDIVKAAILNKAYLAQLIEIQQARGAKNGHIAVQSLELHGNVLADPPSKSMNMLESVVMEPPIREPPLNSRTKEIEDVLEMILTKPNMDRSDNLRYRRLMQQLVAKDVHDKKLGSRLAQSYGTATNMQAYARIKVVQYIQKLLQTPRGKYVFQKLPQSSAICSFFRSLLSWQPETPESLAYLTQVVDMCIRQLSPKTNPALIQILQYKSKTFTKPSPNDQVAVAKQHDFVQFFETASTMDLEVKGKQLLVDLIQRADTEYMVGAITAALKSESGVQAEKIGLLVDWLSNVDSELVQSTQVHQLDMLFSKSAQHFRFHLLSLLSHQSNWATMHGTVSRLLSEHNDNYDPSSVLYFIEALISNPKLWQGRDKATPKHAPVEYVLNMNAQQLQVFTDYILNEADENRLNERVKVLLRCVRQERFNIQRLVKHVCSRKETDKGLVQKFLQQLYLKIPPMKRVVPDLQDVYTADAKQLIGCETDIIASYTLTAISSLSAVRESKTMAVEMDLLVRKLTATHPALILRQLSVIASLLQGRAHMDLSILRQKSWLLFNQVLGLLELLQPHIFAEPHKDALHQALDCYFTLLRHHGHTKDIYFIMYRFMELLQSYTNYNANRALNFIEQYAELMQYLSSRNRTVTPLQQLVQGISLLKHRHSHDFRNIIRSDDGADVTEDTKTSATTPVVTTSEPDSTGAAAVILAPFSRQNLIPPHWPNLVKKCIRRNGDDLLATLQEIEAVTHKRQGLLEPLFDRILELLISPNAALRATAHILMVRHLKFNSGHVATNRKALTAYVQCLRDEDLVVVQSALVNLTEVVICLQEYAAELLNLVFDLGIRSKLNTNDHIRRCVLALKTQHAC